METSGTVSLNISYSHKLLPLSYPHTTWPHLLLGMRQIPLTVSCLYEANTVKSMHAPFDACLNILVFHHVILWA
jgi:hypothetical protein